MHFYAYRLVGTYESCLLFVKIITMDESFLNSKTENT